MTLWLGMRVTGGISVWPGGENTSWHPCIPVGTSGVFWLWCLAPASCQCTPWMAVVMVEGLASCRAFEGPGLSPRGWGPTLTTAGKQWMRINLSLFPFLSPSILHWSPCLSASQITTAITTEGSSRGEKQTREMSNKPQKWHYRSVDDEKAETLYSKWWCNHMDLLAEKQDRSWGRWIRGYGRNQVREGVFEWENSASTTAKRCAEMFLETWK